MMLLSSKKVLQILFIFQEFLYFTQADEFNIVFIIDSEQKDFGKDVSAVLLEIEQMHLYRTSIKDFVLVVNKSHPNNISKEICRISSKKGVSTIVDITYKGWRNRMNILDSKRVPYLQVDAFLSPILEAFSHFLKEKSANDVAMIFQSQQEMEATFYDIVRDFPFRTIIVSAEDKVDFVKRLAMLRPVPSYFAVFAQSEAMNSIFEKIKEGKLFARPAEWHFIFLDGEDQSFKYGQHVEGATMFTINARALCEALQIKRTFCGPGFTFRKVVLFETLRVLLALHESNESKSLLKPLRADCSSHNTSMEYFNLTSKFKATDKFLVISDDNDDDDDETNFLRLRYTVNMSISSFSGDANAETILATWERDKMYKINATISPAKRFFRIGTAEAIPWSYYKREPVSGQVLNDVNGKSLWEGYCIDLIASLAERMNFDYEIVSPRMGLFGKRNELTGNWDGIIGDLVSGETDFAVAALKMTSEREEVIDYIAPYFEQTGISIVIRKPVRQTSLFKFMTVMRLEVWLSIIAALVATAIMLWLLDKYSPYSAKNNKKAYSYPSRDFTLKESFWFALTSFTPQGGGEAPKAISSRILVAAYWLFVVLMLATFTANLAAFLTVERMQTPVQSLEQLARQSRINYTVVEGSDVHQYFINMKFAEDTMYRLWKELALNATTDQGRYRVWDYPIKEQYGHILLAINASSPVRTAAEGFRKVNAHKNADFAFIHDSAEIKYEMTKNCNFTEVGEVFAEQPYAIAVQQGSHLSDEISYTLLTMQKDRLLEKLTAKYWNFSLNTKCSHSDNQEGITLESLGGVFIATLCGLAFAMITLAGEVIYYKKKERTRIISVKPAAQTPPPSFDVATRRIRNVSERVTLGGDKFVPRKNLKILSQNVRKNKNPSAWPVYYE